MTAPRYAPCTCGHAKNLHEAQLAPQCVSPRCECLRYRPQAPAPVKGGAPSAEQLINAGKQSGFKRTVALAQRIETQLADLRGRLLDERARAETERKAAKEREAAQAEIERLEQELAAAKNKLRGGSRARSSSKRPTGACPECDGRFVNVGVHRARVHGYRAAS